MTSKQKERKESTDVLVTDLSINSEIDVGVSSRRVRVLTLEHRQRNRISKKTPEEIKQKNTMAVNTRRLSREIDNAERKKGEKLFENNSLPGRSSLTVDTLRNTVDVSSLAPTRRDRLIDMIDKPSPTQLSNFEFNVETALLLFHENSGLDRFRSSSTIDSSTATLLREAHETQEQTNPLPEKIRQIYDEIGDGISYVTKNSCIQSFQEKLNYDSPLLACGACGVRKFTTQYGLKCNLNNSMLDLLILTPEAVQNHDRLGVYKSVCSIFIDPNDDKRRFYLHPELVVNLSPSSYEVYICINCVGFLKKKYYQNIL